jgi:RNA polymerase sigma-70 factor (ECF subfamily)
LTSATPAFEPAGAPRTDLERTWRAYVQRIAAADQAALAALYDATNRLIYGMALRILGNPADAEEVTLDIYTQVWRSASNFDERRGSVAAWLMTMARSRAIDRLRSGANRSRREESLMELDGVATGQAPMHLGVEREVQAALRALAPEQREAIELAYWYGYSHAELAARLGQPLGTVKTRIRMGMMKLRSQLGALS